jgi:hypothetical protein
VQFGLDVVVADVDAAIEQVEQVELAGPGRRRPPVSSLDLRNVRDARDVVAAMHELAVREAVGSLTQADLEAMRAANRRFRGAIEQGDVEAALRADDGLHGVPVAVTSNQALAAVLDQYTPVLRRAERLRFSSLGGRASVARHDELIRLCAAGDADQAAAVAFDTWRTPCRPSRTALLDAFRISPAATDPQQAEIVDTLWGRGADDLVRPGNAVAAAGEMLLVLVDRLCAAGPAIVIIDDMQWADDATVAVWSRLDLATQQMPLLLVAAARPVPRRDAIDRLRCQMVAGGGVTIHLGAFDDDEVGQLVRQVVTAPPGIRLLELLRQAGGNPFYTCGSWRAH